MVDEDAMKELHLDIGVQSAMFEHLVLLARAFAEVLQQNNPTAKTQLDGRLAEGMATRLSFTLGSYGPENFEFELVRLDGGTLQLMRIDAPPSEGQFRFASH